MTFYIGDMEYDPIISTQLRHSRQAVQLCNILAVA